MTIEDIRYANLLVLIGEHGLKGLASMLGHSSTSTLSQLRNRSPDSKTGKPKNVGTPLARHLEKVCNKEIGWMDKLHPDVSTDPPNKFTVNEQRAAYNVGNVEDGPDLRGEVPLIDWVKAGDWNAAADPYCVGDAEDWYPKPRRAGPGTYCLRIRGDSMTNPYPSGKSYPEGCIIFVDPNLLSPVSGDPIIAKMEGSDERTFKVFMQEGTRIWLKPLNPQHPLIFEPFKVLGSIIGKWEDA